MIEPDKTPSIDQKHLFIIYSFSQQQCEIKLNNNYTEILIRTNYEYDFLDFIPNFEQIKIFLKSLNQSIEL